MPTSTHPRAPQWSPGLPAARWARVRRIQLIQREVREFLAPSAVELLWGKADVVVEGAPELGARSGEGDIYASVMVTVDLRELDAYFREPADAATAERIAELMARDPRTARRLEHAVRARLGDLAERTLRGPFDVAVEPRVRHQETRVLIDADVTVTPAVVETRAANDKR